MLEKLDKCNICPHQCKVNRNQGKIGRCKATEKIKIALYSTHNFEEPCISGEKGSGTIFFSNCNLNCVFCQNYEISQLGKGKDISIEELANIFLKQQEKNVENINLVTPTSYIPQIIEAIKIAKSNGFKLPIIYNTNAYEKIDNYFEIATKAIQEMIRQVGIPELNKKGIMQKGVMIRHLVLPSYIENSKKVLKWIKDNLDDKIYVSIMAQYFPTYKAKEYEKINRKLTKEEWKKIENYIEKLEIENG